MKEGIVAFVDILGFSNQVKEGSKKLDPSDLERILRLIENLASINHEGGAVKIGEGSYSISPTVTSFSDCLIISQYLDINPTTSNRDLNLEMGLFNIITAISYITGFCLSHGFLVRGGISFGTIKHTKNIIFGAPYIEAVEIEKNLAVMPRVVIHDSLVRSCEYRTLEKLRFSHGINKDVDGLLVVDWIEGIVSTNFVSHQLSKPIFLIKLPLKPLKKHVVNLR